MFGITLKFVYDIILPNLIKEQLSKFCSKKVLFDDEEEEETFEKWFNIRSSVTRKKSPNVYKSCPKIDFTK